MFAAFVPDSEREHPAQVIDQIGSIVLVQMDDHLRIRPRGEPMSARQQPLSQQLEVINLAIEDHPHRAIFIRQWLMTVVQVDDAQAAHPESDA